MSLEFKLFTSFIHQSVVETFFIISYEVLRDIIPINDVSLNEVENNPFFYLFKWHNFCPFGDVVYNYQYICMTSGRFQCD